MDEDMGLLETWRNLAYGEGLNDKMCIRDSTYTIQSNSGRHIQGGNYLVYAENIYSRKS